MIRTIRTSAWTMGVAVTALAIVPARGAEPPKNPFANKSNAPAPAAPAATPLDRMELRGIMTVAGKTTITVVDTTNNKPYVIPLDGSVDGFSVSDYRSQEDSIVLSADGLNKKLQLGESKIVTQAVAPTPSPTVAANNQAGAQAPPQAAAGGQPGGPIQQISDEEVRSRMERVAEEIRRRRAMRRQMMQQAQSNQ